MPDLDLRQHRINGLDLLIPKQHKLPNYQREHKFYDQFLPFLCSEISDRNRLVIDVGANVGDTTYAVAQSCENPIFAVEGYKPFFDILQVNISRLPDPRRVQAVCALLGTGRFPGSLVADETTATLSLEAAPTTPLSLDELIYRSGPDPMSVALVKVDTDGFDADVILSGENLIREFKPILFWENHFTSIEQMHHFEDMYDKIYTSGYDRFTMFDNFGNIIIDNGSLEAVLKMNTYLYAQMCCGASRTFGYTDVLASTAKDERRCQHAVKKYQSEFMRIPVFPWRDSASF